MFATNAIVEKSIVQIANPFKNVSEFGELIINTKNRGVEGLKGQLQASVAETKLS